MADEKEQKSEQSELVPRETPETEISKLLGEEDPEVAIIRLEKVAELAPRWQQAMRTILMTFTFPQDWEVFGEGNKAKACLSSAGATRVATKFPIKFFEVEWKKEEWTDAEGKAYRYVYHGKATLGERIVFAQGNYSTRDKFLGYKDGEWKDVAEINEGFIRNAAYHIFEGNAIKALLGLRAMPKSEYEKLMGATKQDTKKTTGHTYGKGTKGGTTQDDTKMQQELCEACITIVQAGYTVEHRNKDVVLTQMSDYDSIREPLTVAKEVCIEISSFIGKDSEKVSGKPASELKGQRLTISLAKAKELAEKAKQ
jgi:hypothetical protein